MKNSGLFLGGLITGATLGAALALLFAPQSGIETREQLKDKMDDLEKELLEMRKNLSEKGGELKSDLKKKMNDIEKSIEKLLNEYKKTLLSKEPKETVVPKAEVN